MIAMISFLCGLPAGITHINAEEMKAMEIYGLTVEYMPSPIAVDVENPRFG